MLSPELENALHTWRIAEAELRRLEASLTGVNAKDQSPAVRERLLIALADQQAFALEMLNTVLAHVQDDLRRLRERSVRPQTSEADSDS
ncbi:hypothetical protein [Roseateles amylovorans]|jgi:hypothetical protein|uniref:Uncharacterized protein n=1 Tax=Roseateles amylovorans TaxID=2978473 RepID=A0ABY6AXY5_9BURK|nr:hypothetical protein [Roseateles amylovorans]UXH77158.1 hypothetical protein N4261_19380 [Roseateles amylovorans]